MDAARLASQLEYDCQLIMLDSVSSTNDEALDLAQKSEHPLSPPLIVTSSEQTAGRGRLGRDWASPSGGVYLSAVFELEALGQDAGTLASLSPLIALAVRNALQCFQKEEVLIKWPNDVLSFTGKLAGILIETKRVSTLSSDAKEGSQLIVIGVGINVNRPDTGAFENASYLGDNAGRRLVLEDVAAAVINGLLGSYRLWEARGCSFESFVPEYSKHMALINGEVCVRNALGDEIARGTVEGIDEKGRLVLSGASGKEAITAGEVTLRNS